MPLGGAASGSGGSTPYVGSLGKRSTSPLPQSSVKTVKVKKEGGGWQRNLNNNCFLLSLLYYYNFNYLQSVNLTGGAPTFNLEGASEPEKTLMNILPAYCNKKLTLKDIQDIFNQISQTPFDGVEITDPLEFDAEPGATNLDELRHAQDGILSELSFNSMTGWDAIQSGRLDNGLLSVNVELLEAIDKGKNIRDLAKYKERNHMVFLMKSDADGLTIKDPNVGGDKIKTIDRSLFEELSKKHPDLVEVLVKMNEQDLKKKEAETSAASIPIKTEPYDGSQPIHAVLLDDVKKTFVEIPRNIDSLTLSKDKIKYLCLFKDKIPQHINEIALPELNDMKTLASIINNIPAQVRNICLTNVPESEDYREFFRLISRFSGLSLLRPPQNSNQFYKNLPSSIARFGLGSLPATDAHKADFKTLPNSVQILIIKEGMSEHDIQTLLQQVPKKIQMVRFDGQVYASSFKFFPEFIENIGFPIPELDDNIKSIFNNIPGQVHTLYLNFQDIRGHKHARTIFASIPEHIQHVVEFSEQELPDKSILSCFPDDAFLTIKMGVPNDVLSDYKKLVPRTVFLQNSAILVVHDPVWYLVLRSEVLNKSWFNSRNV